MLILIAIGKSRLFFFRFGERQIFKLEGVRKWAKSQISNSVPSKILKLYEITVQIYYMVKKLYFGVREHQFCARGPKQITSK